MLGKTGFEVSAVTYGGIVSSAILDDRPMEPYEQGGSDQQVAWAVDQGINYFDVAPTFGNAQEMPGNSLKPYRSKIRLACKTEERRRVNAQPLMEESLKLLHTDHFDVYQMHALKTQEDLDIAFGPRGVMEMMQEMKEKGIALNLGFHRAVMIFLVEKPVESVNLYLQDIGRKASCYVFIITGFSSRMIRFVQK